MSQSISLAKGRTQGTPMVDETNEHEYAQARPINSYFEPVFFAIHQACDPLRAMKIQVSMGMSDEAAAKQRHVGVFQADFDHFHCVLNWTPDQQGKVPPCHILVEYAGEEMGILSPFTDGQLIDGKPSRNEWWGKLITLDDLWEAAATTVADKTHKPYLFGAFDGYDVQERKRKKD